MDPLVAHLASLGDHPLVRVERSLEGADVLEGVLLSWGAKWLLLARLDPNIYLDGLTALRLDDVDEVDPLPNASFVSRALTLRGLTPPEISLDLDSTLDLLSSLSALSPLLTLHYETDDPDVCYIGHPTRIAPDDLVLLELAPDATWDPEPDEWDMDDITRVEVLGSYEEALLLVAGPPPEDT